MRLRPPACSAPIILCMLAFAGCGGEHKPAPGTVLDEASQANRAVFLFPPRTKTISTTWTAASR